MTAATEPTAPTGPERPGAPVETSEHGWLFWISFVVGLGAMLFGLRGLLQNIPDSHFRIRWAQWFVGADLIHDVIVAPVIVGVGWLVYRVVPVRYRPAVRWGLIGTGLTFLLGAAPLRRTAKVPNGNPTVQPLNYSTAVATVLIVVWAIALVWALAVWGLGRRDGEAGGRSAPAEDSDDPAGTVRG